MTARPSGSASPGRAWLLGAAALAVAIASLAFGRHLDHRPHHGATVWLIVAAAVVLVASGAIAIRHLARAVALHVGRRGTLGAASSVRLVMNGFGVVVLILAVFAVLGVSFAHLLIGAGVTGIIIGIAAQQSLSNVFAAAVLLFARPFVAGDHIRIRSGVLGVLDVTVVSTGLTYVTVRTDEGLLQIPNAVLLASGIGHPPAPPPDPTGAA